MRQCEDRIRKFCDQWGLRVPILLAPMAGVDVPELSAAVANSGGMGACGALLMAPEKISKWASDFRALSSGPFQMNLWIRDPLPHRDPETEAQLRAFLGQWGPAVAEEAGNQTPPDFEQQFEAILAARPTAVSSIMGLFEPRLVRRLRDAGIGWLATATTTDEARAAEAAGADIIVAQGMEAGGHRGSFEAGHAADRLVGLFALVPAIVDAVSVPVVAAGGIADGRGVAAAIALGAAAVEVGTGFLRAPEAAIPPAWADALARTSPEETILSRVFSGRPGRSVRTAYVAAATAEGAPDPAPYPVQRGLTAAMRAEAARLNDIDRMQAWAGQSAMLAASEPASAIVSRLWQEARELLDWADHAA